MADVKWIKLSTHMFEDEKIRLIESLPEADTILIIWVKLLAQAGKTNASGYIYLNENIPFTDEMLATIFNRPVNVVRLALKTFEQFGMIEISDEHYISISNWEKHQNVDGLEKIKEQTRKRVAKHRESKQKKDVTLRVTQSNAIEEEAEEDKEEELDLEKEKAVAAYTSTLLQKFVSLRAYGFDHSPMDVKAATEIQSAGIPLSNALMWLEEKFIMYKPKHSRDRINSLDYCVGYILDKHYESLNQGGDDSSGKKVHKHRSGTGRPSKTAEQAMREADEARRAWGG